MVWEDLLSIAAEVALERAAEENQPLVSCPNDGEPLRTSVKGQVFCPFDGWLYPQDSW